MLSEKASPIPRPSTNEWAQSAPAPSGPRRDGISECAVVVIPLAVVVEVEEPLRQEERQEPAPDEEAQAARVVHLVDRLRQHVEEGDRDDDAAGEREQRLEPGAQPERREPAGEGRPDGEERERDRDPGHAAQLRQSP